MKRLITLVLAAAMLMTCVSAFADGTAKFWEDGKLGNPELAEKILTAWNEATGMTIEMSDYTDTASYQTAVSQSIDSDSAPDFFTWWSGEQLGSLVASNKIMELDDLWETIIGMGVAPDVKNAFTYDGHAYAVPYSLLYNVCLYNVDAFAKAGITEMPATFDEFLADCQKMVDAGITPIGIKNDSWASFIWFQAIVAAYDPDLYQGICDGSIAYTDDKMVEVMAVWQDMLDKGYFADPVYYADNFKRFALGEVAIMIEPQTAVPDMGRDYGMEPEVNISAFVLPSMNGAKPAVFFEAAPMAVPAKVADPANAKAALAGYYTTEVQNVTAAEEGIILVAGVESTNATISKITALANDPANTSMLRFYENTPSALRDVALDELSKFMYGEQDAASCLANIQVKADETFAK
ncbi:MAG: extracellular solute-binding protein [Clostridiales bacterium]|nr:extracellular solute-binding protein [Clostridiales bacterium]MDY5513676.1 extracellular solute-binding protein [Candidatus Ventricola sp.]